MIRRRFQEISTLALLAAMTAGPAMAQEALPDIEVGKPKASRPSSKPNFLEAARGGRFAPGAARFFRESRGNSVLTECDNIDTLATIFCRRIDSDGSKREKSAQVRKVSAKLILAWGAAMIRRRFREISTLALLAAMTAGPAMAQEALPDIEVGKPKPARPSSKPKKPAVAHVAAPRASWSPRRRLPSCLPAQIRGRARRGKVRRDAKGFQRAIHHRQTDQRRAV